MKCAEAAESVSRAETKENAVCLPLGLLGFERLKEYVLFEDPATEPFLWLQVKDNPSLAFLVMSPFSILSTYKPDISPDDARYLGLEAPQDAIVLNIVTLRNPPEATLNLKGPIVINRRTRVGKQVIPLNAADYSVQHPLPVAAP